MSRLLHICHVFSTFVPAGPELRTVAILNALGPRLRHTIMAADGRYSAAKHLGSGVGVELVPPPRGKGGLFYGLAMSRAIQRIAPDLLVTYNWGAFDALIGARLGRLCPIIHTEDGFGPDEGEVLKWRRVLARQLFLRTIVATVVPSKTLLEVALTRYRLPRHKVLYLPNGVDLARFRPRRSLAWRRSHGVPDDALLFGAVGGLRPVKNLSLLLRAFARATLPDAWLAIVGEGPCRREWENLAERLGVARRVVFAGEVLDPAPCYAAFDVFVMASSTEQMPIALLEAMACGLPAICTNVGDCREMLGNGGSSTIVPRGDEASYASALVTLAESAALRAALGAANRARCIERYPQDRMIERYAALYAAAISRGRRLAEAVL